MIKDIMIKFDKYPIAIMSSLIGVGAFSAEISFTNISLNNLLIAIGKGSVEFVIWYLWIKVLAWIFSNKKVSKQIKSHTED